MVELKWSSLKKQNSIQNQLTSSEWTPWPVTLMGMSKHFAYHTHKSDQKILIMSCSIQHYMLLLKQIPLKPSSAAQTKHGPWNSWSNCRLFQFTKCLSSSSFFLKVASGHRHNFAILAKEILTHMMSRLAMASTFITALKFLWQLSPHGHNHLIPKLCHVCSQGTAPSQALYQSRLLHPPPKHCHREWNGRGKCH